LCERDILFSSLREFRPELCDRSFQLDFLFLQNVQQAGAAQSFGGRPEEHDRVGGPRVLAVRVAKSAEKIDDLLSILPDRDGRAEFTEVFELPSKERFD
jgi:hypothetical protein